MKIHIHGQNKPLIRSFDKEGNYKSWKTAHYSSHRIVDNMTDAQMVIQEMLNKNWDVSIETEL